MAGADLVEIFDLTR